MKTKIKIKQLTLEEMKLICQTKTKCYDCPLHVGNCMDVPENWTDEMLEKEVELEITENPSSANDKEERK